MGLQDIFIKMTIVGVLFLSIMSWIVITQIQNDPTYLITNNTEINSSYGGLSSNFNKANVQAETASGTFTNKTPVSNLGFTSIASIVSPTRIFRGLVLGTYNILIILPAKFLGVPPVIIAVLNSILLLLLILGAWFVWKGAGT